ncbi:type II toxin-antitoxin system RelE/ParE family toxin [Candidatus Pacearchaeota archaeon]|nr:type II toxin-antitoxin system RelE/ParE family toxin [Candidatus Pacearchaeota archaeon]
MIEWIIKLHPDFLRDLDKLDKKHIEIFYKKKEKIKQNPLRLKHLSGGENCYREEITRSIRLVYYVESNTIWLLTIGPHDKAYKEYLKRLHNLRQKLK